MTTAMPKSRAAGRVLSVMATLALAAAVTAAPAPSANGQSDDEALKKSTWNPLNRTSAGHFRVADSAKVGSEEAEAVYRALAPGMVARYALSGIPAAADYTGWTRYNTAPYRSVPHGRSYHSNYANATARAYGRYENAGTLPVGSVLAKDSFSIRRDGQVLPGSLFLLEKMQPGFNPESGDWRYTQILPDGSVLGTTKGDNAEYVGYCVPCHAAAGEGRDHLFFPRKPFRRRIAESADVFEAGGGSWLLAPAPPELVDILAVIGAADEDAELDEPIEDDDPREP